MNTPVRYAIVGIAAVTLLAGCKNERNENANLAGDDPAMTGALGDQIMVDPELSGQNGAAVSGGAGNVELPAEQRSPEAIAAARQEAAEKAGGSLESAPEAKTGSTASLVENAATAAQVAESARAASTDCAEKVEYAMGWSNRLPAALSIYPRGALQEAAGIEKDGCSLRVISFVSPVAPGDIVDYYYTRTRKAGYNADHRIDGGDHVLGGKKGGAAYLIFARKLDNGLSEVDLIASGK